MLQGKRGGSIKKVIFQVGGTGYGMSLQKTKNKTKQNKKPGKFEDMKRTVSQKH